MALFTKLPDADYLPTWYEQRNSGGKGPLERSAAEKAAIHADTPTTACFDTLGRTFLTVAHNKFQRNSAPIEEKYGTRTILDIEGNQREVIDAKDRVVMRYDYDMLGNRIHQSSMEAGERWMLNDVAGKPIRTWDSRGHNFRTEYDVLRRPVGQFVIGTDATYSDPRTLSQELLFEKTEYGEGQADDRAVNLRTRVFKHHDPAGTVTSEQYDFKGNLLQGTREVAELHKEIPNWSGAVPMAESFTSFTTFDALNRPVTLTSPDQSITRPSFNEANLLEHLEANLRGSNTVTVFIDDIDYNAKGQRTLIDYHMRGTNRFVRTEFTYDAETFRLTKLTTTRPNSFSSSERTVQALSYIYDPVGNITHIQDDAQQTIFFRNRRVEPSNDYIYDAVYRLIEATGREHLGQNGGGSPLPPRPTSYNDAPHVGLLHPNNREAMGTYLEQYEYDEVGNFISLIHRGSDPANPGWTRAYTYNETSQLERSRKSNRLTRTTVGSITEAYSIDGDGYDPHGNMLHMPQLQIMQWDFRDQLCMTQRQKVNDQDAEGIQKQGERTYYVYDATGQRLRKVTEHPNGTRKDERIYLGGFELYRNYGTDGTSLSLEHETLHIMDDKQRIALVETKSYPAPLPFIQPEQLIRFQFGNHLGSAALELSDDAIDISYEEYHPYGSSAYQGMRDRIKVPRRYRYTGKERDEESGLYYHGARYYVPWIGRWIACDPANLVDGLNLYQYVMSNPTRYRDPSGQATGDDDLKFVTTSPMRRVELAPHVDEVDAVKGHLAGGVAGSPSDIANKQYADPRTNVQTKSNFVGNAPANPRPTVSAATSPQEAGNRLITGRFSEVQEMKALAADATARTKPGERTNPILRENMKQNEAIRGAHAAVGINPDTLKAENPPGIKQFPKTGSVNLSPVDADLDPATGKVVPGPNTSAAIERRNSGSFQSGSVGSSLRSRITTGIRSAATSVRSSVSAAVQAVRNNPRAALTSAGSFVGGTLARAFIPGAAEVLDARAAVGLRNTLSLAARAAAPLAVVAAGATAGYIAGDAVEAYVTRETGSRTAGVAVGTGAGVLAGAAAGAAVGAAIGALGFGIGAVPGAAIGAAAGAIAGFIGAYW
jgi:RHS repeat-associated protein